MLGGIFLLACDPLVRLPYSPAGLPVGLFTTLLRVPFFVYLSRKIIRRPVANGLPAAFYETGHLQVNGRQSLAKSPKPE